MKQQVHWVMGPDWTSTNLCTMQEGSSWVVISLYSSPIGSPQVVGSTYYVPTNVGWVGIWFSCINGVQALGDFLFERTAWMWVFAFLPFKESAELWFQNIVMADMMRGTGLKIWFARVYDMVLWQKLRWVYSGYKPRSLTNREPRYLHFYSKVFDI